MAGAYHLAICRHMQIKAHADLKVRGKKSPQLVGLVLVVGMVPGVLFIIWHVIPEHVRAMNCTLQNYATDRPI